jgi:DNA-binding NarL/FixJ family response regulator
MIELERLEAVVTSSTSLELVGSSLGGAGSARELVDTSPDVVLAHFELDDPESGIPDWNGNAVVWVLIVTDVELPLIASHPDHSVRGILPFDASAREIQIAIAAAAEGLFVFHPGALEHLTATSAIRSGSPRDSAEQLLSPRESEILNMLAAGLGNKQIAWRLKISEHTVKFHVTSVFHKLNASSRAEAVAIGMRRGLIVL